MGLRGLEAVPLPLPRSERLHSLTIVMSWLTVIGEGSVAAFHAFGTRRLYRVRHLVLTTFILATYFLLPVLGFAFMLTILGLAQCDEDDEMRRFRYLILLGTIQLTMIPWRTLLMDV
jgi:hypothetical protein